MKKDNLHNIKKTGFKTPDSYFENLDVRVMQSLKDHKALNDIKSPGFKAPEGYFESFEARIDQNLPKHKVVKVIPLFSRKNVFYISGIAAAILLMFGIFNGKTDTNGFDTLDTELVESYLEGQDLNTFDIASMLTDEEIADADFGISDVILTEDSIEDYLLENMDLESIIEQ